MRANDADLGTAFLQLCEVADFDERLYAMNS